MAKERDAASRELQSLSEELTRSAEFTEAEAPAQREVTASLTALADRLAQERLIPSIRTVLSGFRRDRYPQLVALLLRAKPRAPEKEGETPQPEETIEVVNLNDLGVRFNRHMISSEDDVDTYLNNMRDAMITAVRSGKRITL